MYYYYTAAQYAKIPVKVSKIHEKYLSMQEKHPSDIVNIMNNNIL